MTSTEFQTGDPATQAMQERWTILSNAVANAAGKASSVDRAEIKGTLVVLGSGITHGDLTIDVEDEIKSADYVFFSINNYVTKSWLAAMRPDAYDLAILYNESVDRHDTYTRMAESILYHVRCGKTVVAVLYGHPGIFAAPGHRAVQIARKEGHHARMRAGISALDHLIADVGFDPAAPGMATFEATSMLLAKREIDTSLHVVIWQVGLVGERGFERHGYANRGLNDLADALKRAYGSDWEIIHYIGAQYAGCEPRIEHFTIGSLYEPSVAKRLSTLSTFYIRPKIGRKTDTGTNNGSAKADHVVSRSEKPPAEHWLGNYCRYGDREIQTLNDFSALHFSPGYRVVACRAPVVEFLIKLSSDSMLRSELRKEPSSALSSASCGLMSDYEKRLLGMRLSPAMVVALTGWTLSDDGSKLVPHQS